MQNVEQAVHSVLQSVAEEKSISLGQIQNHHALIEDIGFSSLDFASVIAILEIELDADPFSKLVPITSVRTVGDLSNAYARYFAESEQPTRHETEAESPSVRGQAAIGRRVPLENQRKLRQGVRRNA